MCGRLRLSSGVFVVPQVGTDSMLHAGVGAYPAHKTTANCFHVATNLTPLPHEQNGRHLADNIFKRSFLNWKFYVLIKISLRLVAKGPTDGKAALI